MAAFEDSYVTASSSHSSATGRRMSVSKPVLIPMRPKAPADAPPKVPTIKVASSPRAELRESRRAWGSGSISEGGRSHRSARFRGGDEVQTTAEGGRVPFMDVVFFVLRVYGVGVLITLMVVLFNAPVLILPLYTIHEDAMAGGSTSGDDGWISGVSGVTEPIGPISYNMTAVRFFLNMAVLSGMCLTTIFMVDLARRPTNFQLPKFAQHVRRYSVAVGPEDSEEDGETSPSANLYGGHSSSHDRGASDGGLPPMGRTPTPKSSALTPTPKSGDTLTPQAAAGRMSSHGSLGRMSSHGSLGRLSSHGSLGRLSPTTSLPSASSGHNTAVATDFERSDGINIVTGGEDVNRDYPSCCDWAAAKRMVRYQRWGRRLWWVVPFSVVPTLLVYGLTAPRIEQMPTGLIIFVTFFSTWMITFVYIGVFKTWGSFFLVLPIPLMLSVVNSIAPYVFSSYKEYSTFVQFVLRGFWTITDILFGVAATVVGRVLLQRGNGLNNFNFLFVSKAALSFYGRLLISDVANVQLQIGLSVGVAILELAARLTLITREELFAKFCTCGRRSESVLDDPHVRFYLAETIAGDMMVEVAGVLLAPMFLYLFYHQRFAFDFGYDINNPPVVGTLVITALVQLTLEFVVDLICALWESRTLRITDVALLRPYTLLYQCSAAVYVSWSCLLAFHTTPIGRRACPPLDACTCNFPLTDAMCREAGFLDASGSG